MALVTRALPLTYLMLLLLRRPPGAGAQVGPDFKLQQPQDKVSVTAGETLTLTCTMSGVGPVGPVKWLKGWGSGNETVYDLVGYFPRVTRVVSESNTDFSIRIRDVRPEDAGTYYCVKFSKRLGGLDVFRRGKGTVVSVHGEWGSQSSSRWEPALLGAAPGPSRPISARWALLGASGDGEGARGPVPRRGSHGPSPGTSVPPWETPVPAAPGWVGVAEPGLTGQGTLRAAEPGDARHQALPLFPVSPSVSVVADVLSPVEVNKNMNFTCHVKRFYPGDVAVAWLENGMEIKVENISQPVETPRGLFELRSVVEVQATEEKNGSVFTCRVVHDAQDPVSGTATLLLSSPGLWLGILLEKGLLGGLLIFLFKRARA
uniref:Ig-like domain-containing protein n=1 Tax=Aquila chrysaetos chrysaetos TaxID=223781 RepID=A0A663DKR7_AQUCH